MAASFGLVFCRELLKSAFSTSAGAAFFFVLAIFIPSTPATAGAKLLANDGSPWLYSSIGPYYGTSEILLQQHSISLDLKNSCLNPGLVQESFEGADGVSLKSLGYESVSPLFENHLQTSQGALTPGHSDIGIHRAPVTFRSNDNIEFSATVSSGGLSGDISYRSISLFLASHSAAYLVYYQGNGINGVWRIASQDMNGGEEVVLAEMEASVHPVGAVNFALSKNNNVISVSVEGQGGALSYDLGGAAQDVNSYGIAGKQLFVDASTFVDNLQLTVESVVQCPELSTAGIWDERYPVHFIHQELLAGGELTVRLVSQSDSNLATMGVMVREGVSASDKFLVAGLNPNDNTLSVFIRSSVSGPVLEYTSGIQGTLPQWLKLKRDNVSNEIHVYISVDGDVWTLADTYSLSLASIAKAGVVAATKGAADQNVQFDNVNVFNPLPNQITSPLELQAHQTYHVGVDTFIRSGGRLDIEHGAQLIFANNSGLQVEAGGSLSAVGSQGYSVSFVGESNAAGSWDGLEVKAGGDLHLDHAIVRSGNNGVRISGNAIVANSRLTNNRFGIYIANASPTISNNVIEDNTSQGIYIHQDSSPVIDGNSIRFNGASGNGISIGGSGSYYPGGNAIITNNVISNQYRGIQITGANVCSAGVACLPMPVINSNDITDNTYLNIWATNYGANNSIVINAQNNWWGTTDTAVIAVKIFDRHEGVSHPFVDFSHYLASAGGEPVEGVQVGGVLTGDQTLQPSTTIVGETSIASNTTVRFPADSEIGLSGGSAIRVRGTLIVESGVQWAIGNGSTILVEEGGVLTIEGTATDPVEISNATEQANAWVGIEVSAGATANISHAKIMYADKGVHFNGGEGVVESSEIINNRFGIYITNASPTISDSVIENNTSVGIYVFRDSSPVIDGNSIRFNGTSGNGIEIGGSGSYYPGGNAIITNNVISNQNRGIQITGANVCSAGVACLPMPVINSNDITDNTYFNIWVANYGANNSIVINAQNNWWGTTDTAVIAAKIFDRHEGVSHPFVDFSHYLASAGGEPVEGVQVGGVLTGDQTLQPSTTIVGETSIASNTTVRFPADSEIGLSGGSAIRVRGTLIVESGVQWAIGNGSTILVEEGGVLTIEGTAADPVEISNASEQANAWVGIEVSAGATATVSHARIMYADKGVHFNGGEGGVEFSELTNNRFGIYIADASPTISNNTIENNTSHGIYVYRQSSPLIDGNSIRFNGASGYGIQIAGAHYYQAGNAVITNNIISNQSRGIHVTGSNSCAAGVDCLPIPIINSNDIMDNALYSIWTSSFGNNNSTVINAQNNWWGTTDPGEIAGKIYDKSDSTSAPTVDYSSFLMSAGGEAQEGNQLFGVISASQVIEGDWLVFGDVTIAEGVVLTISENSNLNIAEQASLQVSGSLIIHSGVQLSFNPGSGVIVGENGNLNSYGTIQNPVVYTSENQQIAAWNGVEIGQGGSIHFEHSLVEYAQKGVYLNGGAGEIRSSQFINNQYGIYIEKASPIIMGNEVHLNSIAGLYITNDSYPAVSENTFVDNLQDGIRIQASSSVKGSAPIFFENIISGNVVGLNIHGTNACATGIDCRLLPQINNNSFQDNSQYNLKAHFSGTPDIIFEIEAKNSWWGTTSPTEIAESIYDRNDYTSSPIVNYANFLGEAEGEPVGGVQYGGLINEDIAVNGEALFLSGAYIASSANITLNTGSNVTISSLGHLNVEGRLVVNSNSNLTMGESSSITVVSGGELVLDGEPGSRITLDLEENDLLWNGIYVKEGGSVSVNYVDIHGAYNAVNFEAGSGGAISNSALTGNTYGVYVVDTSPSISNNVISNNSGTGIHVINNASPMIQGNSIENNGLHGIYLANQIIASNGPAPSIRLNSIKNNLGSGVRVQFPTSCTVDFCNPLPVTTENSIYANASDDFYTAGARSDNRLTLNAKNNWWGTTDIAEIADSILDRTDANTKPVVDYSGILLSDGGDISAKTQVVGYLPAGTVLNGDIQFLGATFIDQGELTIAPNSQVEVLGFINVGRHYVPGQAVTEGVLTVESGAALTFHENAQISVLNAVIDISGVEVAPVHFSGITQAHNSWAGIKIEKATFANINHALIQDANYGVEIIGSNLDEKYLSFFSGPNSGLYTPEYGYNSSQAGYYENEEIAYSPVLVENSHFTNNNIGIFISKDSPVIKSNRLENNKVAGIRVLGNASPLLEENTIQFNDRSGVQVFSSGLGGPNPDILDNVIAGNLKYGVEIQSVKCANAKGIIYSAPYDDYWRCLPQARINNNSIYDNVDHGLYVGGQFDGYLDEYEIDARSNWWGSIDPSFISREINDRSDDRDIRVIAKFGGFLDGVDGEMVPGDQLEGRVYDNIDLDGTVLVLGHTIITPDVNVSVGESTRFVFTYGADLVLEDEMNVPAGTVFEMSENSGITVGVYGELNLQGSLEHPIEFSLSENVSGAWRGISVGGSASINYANIKYANIGVNFYNSSGFGELNNSKITHNGIGVKITGSETNITNNLIENNQVSGLHIENLGPRPPHVHNPNANTVIIPEDRETSPSISDNVIRFNNSYGINITGNGYLSGPTPQINRNYISYNKVDGIRVSHGNCDYGRDCRPRPIVNFNSLHSNNTYDFRSANYGPNNRDVLDLKNNWWGSTDPDIIRSKIYDREDAASAPIVDFRGFLATVGGDPIPGLQLAGYIGSSEIEEPALVLGMAYVEKDDVLTLAENSQVSIAGALNIYGDMQIAQGSELVFTKNSALNIKKQVLNNVTQFGSLSVLGSEISPVTFTGGLEQPGYWAGIKIEEFSSFEIENAIVTFAKAGVTIIDSVGSINKTIINSNDEGLVVESSSPVVSNSVFTNNVRNGILIQTSANKVGAAPLLSGAQVFNNHTGISVKGTATCVLNVECLPKPVINNSQLLNNRYYEYSALGFPSNNSIELNAQNNWWGTYSPDEIAEKIQDRAESTGSPIVDYSGFRISSDGPSVPGNQLLGIITGNQVVEGEVTMLGQVIVLPDATLTLASSARILVSGGKIDVQGILDISDGAQIQFGKNSGIDVQAGGLLNGNGTQNQPILLSTSQSSSTPGGWKGIELKEGAGISLNYGVIEYAQNGIAAVSPVLFEVTNSIFTMYSNSGIKLSDSSLGLIKDNLFEGVRNVNYQTGYLTKGIELWNASPQILDNIITNNQHGIYIYGNSSPLISGNSIYENVYGIYLYGTGNDLTSPTPIISGNDIYDNLSRDIYFLNYAPQSAIVIDAKNNYWGPDGVPSIYQNANSGVTIDASFPTSEPYTSTTGSLTVPSGRFFSPNGDSIKDTLQLQGEINESLPWSIQISNGATVRTISGTSNSVNTSWDGLTSGGGLAEDGYYQITLTVENRVVAYNSVILDTVEPEVVLLAPEAGSNLITSASVIATVFDSNNIEHYSVDYKLTSDAAGAWQNLGTGEYNKIQESLFVWSLFSGDGVQYTPNGTYEIKLTGRDFAGNLSQTTTLVTVSASQILNVSHSTNMIDFGAQPSTTISYEVNSPAEVTLTMLKEGTKAVVREFTQEVQAAGTYSFIWDGKNAEGQLVPDDAYEYIITSRVQGAVSSVFDPTFNNQKVGILSNSIVNISSASNDTFEMAFTLPKPARVVFPIQTFLSGLFYPREFNNTPYPAGEHTLHWNGRANDGNILIGAFMMNFGGPGYIPLAPNSIIVKDAPTLNGAVSSPSVLVKSDPYRIYHSYNQITSVAFTLDRDSFITFKLLPPGVVNPNDNRAITLVNNELMFASQGGEKVDHIVKWDGHDEFDTNSISVSEEGVYNFWIQARSQNGAKSEQYGSLQLYQ